MTISEIMKVIIREEGLEKVYKIGYKEGGLQIAQTMKTMVILLKKLLK